MKNILQVGLVGYGVVGQKRKKFIDLNPLVNTSAICDIRLQNNLSLLGSDTLNYNYKEIENIPEEITNNNVDGIEYYRDYHNMLNNCDLDILFICLPNYLASEATILGLERGCHVFCEKPPARNVAEMKNVIKCYKKHPNLKLKYGFNHRYHESVKKTFEIIISFMTYI